MEKTMKIVVIGGSGFIGSQLVKNLINSGHQVQIFDKNNSSMFSELVTIGDVRDFDKLKNVLKGVDVVFNLAAEHRDDVTPTSLYYDVNVQGAKNIIQAADSNCIKKIIFTSTVAVYGLKQSKPKETSPTEPFNHYGKSKLKAEQVFTSWVAKEEGRALTILRPVVVFGEGNRGNVYNLIKQIQSNKFVMVGLGENRKSMAYVGNVAQFLAQAIDFGAGKHLFNIATNPDMTVRELVELIRAELGISGRMPRLPYVLGLTGGLIFDLLSKITGKKFPISSIRIRKFCADTTVLTEALEGIGFKQPYTLQEGLKRMISNLDHKVYYEGGG
jgi:nucleoside-diphosphate-sugar epimerase